MSAVGRVLEPWDCVVNERGLDGKRHYWNVHIDAYDARDAMEMALSGYDMSRVDACDVTRRSTDYSFGRDVA